MDIDIKFSIAGLQSAGLTQAQIGTELGCSQSVVSDMAAGKCGTSRPSHKIVTGIERLAAKYGVPTIPKSKRHRPASTKS
jgi:predicted XRE-type DNA-binding protein